MILSAAWTPFEQPTFLTAGRDKSVKIWQVVENEVQLRCTVTAAAAVTAVACNSRIINGGIMFAYGTETGDIGVGFIRPETAETYDVSVMASELSPDKTINQIVWRSSTNADTQQMAVVSDDTSLRLYNVE